MEFHWILLVILNVLLMTIGLSLSKKLLFKLNPLQILFYQYIASVICIFLQGVIREKEIFFNLEDFWLVSIGILFGLGIFAINKAFQINLSRSMIASQFNSLFSIVLSAIFIGEYLLFDPSTTSGLLLLLSIPVTVYSVILMKGFGKGDVGKKWIAWVSASVLILGFSMFLVKVLVSDISFVKVLLFQYIGSFIIVSIVGYFSKVSLNIGWVNVLQSMLVGVFFSTALSFLYKAFSIAPLAYVNTFKSVGATVCGVLVGLILFREKETLNSKSIVGMIMGVLAMIFIVVANLVR